MRRTTSASLRQDMTFDSRWRNRQASSTKGRMANHELALFEAEHAEACAAFRREVVKRTREGKAPNAAALRAIFALAWSTTGYRTAQAPRDAAAWANIVGTRLVFTELRQIRQERKAQAE